MSDGHASGWLPPWKDRKLPLRRPFDQRLVGRFKTSALFGQLPAREPSLIEGILPAKGAVGLVADRQSFKTFLANDLALHVSFGRPWFGRQVNIGTVVYVSAEAPEMNQDIRNAWHKTHPDLPDIGYFLPINSAPLLGTKEGDAADLIAFIRQELGVPRLVVVDTVSKVLHSENENGEGMIALMSNAEKIAEAFDCVVLLIHHKLRGSNRGRGAAQFGDNSIGELVLDRRGLAMSAILTVNRLKGQPEGERLQLTMSEPIFVDRYEYDKPMTSLVIQELGPAPERKERAPRAKVDPDTGEVVSVAAGLKVKTGPAPKTPEQKAASKRYRDKRKAEKATAVISSEE